MYVSHTETLEERPEHDCEPLLAIKPNATEECLLSPCQQLLTDTDADIFDATTFATGTERNYENNITAKVQISSSNIVQSFDSSSFSQGLSFPSESAYSVDSDYNRNKVNDKGSEVRFSIPSDYDYSQYNEKYIWRQSGLTECSRSCAGGEFSLSELSNKYEIRSKLDNSNMKSVKCINWVYSLAIVSLKH